MRTELGFCTAAQHPHRFPSVLSRLELIFSHRHKGQVKPEAAGVPSLGPQPLFPFKATRTRMLLCTLLGIPIASADV